MKIKKQFRVIFDSAIFSCDVVMTEKRVIPFCKAMRKNIERRNAKMYRLSQSPWLTERIKWEISQHDYQSPLWYPPTTANRDAKMAVSLSPEIKVKIKIQLIAA